MVKKKYIICIFLLLSLSLYGCWNNVDITKLGVSTAVGIDKAPEKKIRLSVQLVNPAAVRTSSSKQGKSSDMDPVSIFTYEDNSIFDCLRNMVGKLDKKIFYSTSRVIIISEDKARDGIGDIIDFLLRDHETNYQSDILISKNVSAEDILKVKSKTQSLPGNYIQSIIKSSKSRGKLKRTMLIDIAKDFSSKSKYLTIGAISKLEDNSALVEGTAVFNGDRLVGWLSPMETRGFLFATNKMKSTTIDLSNPMDKDELITIEIMRSKGKLKTLIVDNKPVLMVEIETEGNIGEQHGKGSITTKEVIEILENSLQDTIKKEVVNSINITQKQYKSDIFGFGDYLSKFHPKTWSKMEDKWNELYSSAEVQVVVDAKIRRSGLLKETILPKVRE
ncbi:spore germination protein KC [Clostridium amylolyticum]|uniref:Spore germination protein KC n=1 Tax=Clostridium amylolyticum TaxID=1121298 RepID=A0A1M6CKZ8_9CLOT|nr:Ger(x)C family spore germination protein [Clostridium amylolyticum]SHI61639.1 spore germination protein KC [Clostridium amylolyticum]